MRAAFSAPLGALLMIAPLAAIPLLAMIGVPQFAPVVASSVPYDEFEPEPASNAVELGQAETPPAVGSDLFAPIDVAAVAPVAADPGSAPRWNDAPAATAPVNASIDPSAVAVFESDPVGTADEPAAVADPAVDLPPARFLPNGEVSLPDEALEGWDIIGRPARAGLAGTSATTGPQRRPAAFENGRNEFASAGDGFGAMAFAAPAADDELAGIGADDSEELEAAPADDFDQFTQEAQLIDERAAAVLAAEEEFSAETAGEMEPAEDFVTRVPPTVVQVDAEGGDSEFGTAELLPVTSPASASSTAPRARTAIRTIPQAPSDFKQGLVHPTSGHSSPAPANPATGAPTQGSRRLTQLPAANPAAPAQSANAGRAAAYPDSRTLNAEAGLPGGGLGMQEPFTWKVAAQRLKALGIRHYHLESAETEGQFLFSCSLSPRDNPRVTRRFEAEADEPLVAVQRALAEIEEWQRGQ